MEYGRMVALVRPACKRRTTDDGRRTTEVGIAHSSLVTRHSSLVTRHSCIILAGRNADADCDQCHVLASTDGWQRAVSAWPAGRACACRAAARICAAAAGPR